MLIGFELEYFIICSHSAANNGESNENEHHNKVRIMLSVLVRVSYWCLLLIHVATRFSAFFINPLLIQQQISIQMLIKIFAVSEILFTEVDYSYGSLFFIQKKWLM